MDFSQCTAQGYVRNISFNRVLVNALLQMSKLGEKTVIDADITPDNISTYVSVAYESLRQTLEAFCVAKKFKVTNHICLGVVVGKLFSDFNVDDFERFRQSRNSINYYGERINFLKGKSFIKEMFRMKKSVEKEARKLI